MNMFSRFKADCLGNVSMMLALAVVPLCIGAGAAIDFVQVSNSQTILQGAADAAALAGASSRKTNAAELKKIVDDYLAANGANDTLSQVDSVIPVLDPVKKTFSVEIKGKRNTSLMHLVGVDTINLGAYSEIKLGGDGLEVAMVLDVTGSMNASGRLPALKTAANNFVNKLMDAEATGSYVRVGIVPFAEYVNVGLGVRNEPWMNVPADTSVSGTEICGPTFPDRTTKCDEVTKSTLVDGIPTTYTSYENCVTTDGPPGPNACHTPVSTTKWNGCVGSRNDPMDESIGTPSSPYPGLPNVPCNSEIVPLTKNKTTLQSTISGLTANGSTYIPAGLLWGWNMVDSNAPLTEAKTASQIKDMGGSKAIVLMTDGDNTLSADYPYHWGTDGDKADKKVKDLCKNIKDDDIVIYTVSFMVTDDDTVKMLEKCASDPSKALTADNAAQLSQVFDEISASMLALRMTK
jgi:Flp pilus assembly protein TadG